jgi:hypothetical protein
MMVRKFFLDITKSFGYWIFVFRPMGFQRCTPASHLSGINTIFDECAMLRLI